jgi:plastocyanin
MILTRRRMLEAGGATLAALVVRPAAADDVVDIAMQGRGGGAHVWYDPIGIHVRPGQTIRWTNRDPGNAHTATAYHPAILDRPRRVPARAEPWDSDYLLPGEAFSVVLTAEGVYDYYCVPHEHAGMVGRIVVGPPSSPGAADHPPDPALAPLPDVALNGFPPVADILELGIIRRG